LFFFLFFYSIIYTTRNFSNKTQSTKKLHFSTRKDGEVENKIILTTQKNVARHKKNIVKSIHASLTQNLKQNFLNTHTSIVIYQIKNE